MSAPEDRRLSELEDRKRYEPAEVEPRIVKRWLESGLFSPAPDGDRQRVTTG